MKKYKIHDNWLFWKDGCEDSKRSVQLPHDAMILEKRDPDMENGSGAGFFPGGKYYYSRTIFGEKAFEDQAVILEFEGVYHNASVYLNGAYVGGWLYGYTNFFVELTGKLNIGQDNELLVIADNSQTPNARWYTGSGIYRPVNLWVGGKNGILPQSMKIRTLSVSPAVVELSTRGVRGEISYEIFDGDTPVAAGQGSTAVITIRDGKPWSAESPTLYTVKATVRENGIITDEAWERFGIRTLDWSSANGFRVNGKTVKLKGGCIHHDNGILGACTYKDAELRKMRKLKEYGFNAIRFSHYPAGKDLLDACDEVGMYVMDESFDQWRRPKNRYDYSNHFDAQWEKDLAALAEKDYNHPCVIMYCIGNEIGDTGRDYAPELARQMTMVLKSHDDTRPVTIANNAPMSMVSEMMQEFERERGAEIGSLEINELITAHPEILESFKRGTYSAEKLEQVVGKVFDALDITGQNYAHEFYEGIHQLRPDRILLSAETFPQRMGSNWRMVMENDHVIGDFHWTAWDYLGEAGVGLPVYGTREAPFAKPYPCLTAACGSFDINGNPEAAAYYCASLWGASNKPFIGVRPVNHSGEDYTLGAWRLTDAVDCWTWPGCQGNKAEIVLYSTGCRIELLQNGTSLGYKDLCDCKAEFACIYEPGTLEAISYGEDGHEIGRSQLRTAGEQLRLEICPEEMQTGELLFVPIRFVDEHGILRMDMEKKVTVTVEGAGTLLALGSAKYENEESFQTGTHTSWRGALLAVIRCGEQAGTVTVQASAEGCEPVSCTVKMEVQ